MHKTKLQTLFLSAGAFIGVLGQLLSSDAQAWCLPCYQNTSDGSWFFQGGEGNINQSGSLQSLTITFGPFQTVDACSRSPAQKICGGPTKKPAESKKR